MAATLHRLGWILIGVGAACILSLFFVAPGVVAAGLGVLLLAAGAVLRLLPARRLTAGTEPRQPPHDGTA